MVDWWQVRKAVVKIFLCVGSELRWCGGGVNARSHRLLAPVQYGVLNYAMVAAAMPFVHENRAALYDLIVETEPEYASAWF